MNVATLASLNRLTPATLVRFLLGGPASIAQVATSRGSLPLGAILVLSAALAREYDHADLLHQPWWLLVPLAASVVSSLLLYLLVAGVARRRSSTMPTFWRGYGSLLACYWLTAPLAWLYAIPVERFLSEVDAARANLTLLALVAAWRVLVITRVVQVLFQTGWFAAFWLVMLFADTLVLVVLYFAPLPIFNIMGGIRLSEAEAVISETSLLVGFFAAISWPLWLGGCLVVASRERNWRWFEPVPTEPPGVAASSWLLAIGATALGFLMLPWTQPAQQLRYRVERAMTEGRIAEGLQIMSQHQADEFPPHWAPPPYLGYADPQPPLLEVLAAFASENPAPWVRESFVNKLHVVIPNWYFAWSVQSASEKDRWLTVIESLPERPEIVRRHASVLELAIEQESSPDMVARLRALCETER